MSIESAAANILKRGIELDTKKRFTEALVCYQEGLQILVDKMKGMLLNYNYIMWSPWSHSDKCVLILNPVFII